MSSCADCSTKFSVIMDDERLNQYVPNEHTRRAVRRNLRDIRTSLSDDDTVPLAQRIAAAIHRCVDATPSHQDRAERWKRLHAAANLWYFRITATLDAPVRPLGPKPGALMRSHEGRCNTVPTDAEVDALIHAADRRSPQCGILFRLLFTTGLRIGAARNVTWKSLGAPQPVRRLVVVREKGNQLRALLLNDDLRRRLDQLWLTDGVCAGPASLVFAPSGRSSISVRQLNNWWTATHRDANLGSSRGGSHPHSARHYVVHRLFDLGNSLALIAKFLGHRSATTTDRYYLRLSFEEVLARIRLPC